MNNVILSIYTAIFALTICVTNVWAHTLSGRVTMGANGPGLGGVTLEVTINGVRLTQADQRTLSNGEFSITNITNNALVRVNPVLSGYTFWPEIAQYIDRDYRVNIIATHIPTPVPTPRILNLVPTFKCVDQNVDGSYTAHFGYQSANTDAVDIPCYYNSNNFFSPAPECRGQPQRFVPGTIENAFTVVFNGQTIQWKLGDFFVNASSASPRCTGNTGNCPNGTQPDACGVCGGNSSSCLGCLTFNMEALRPAAYVSHENQRRQVTRISRSIVRLANTQQNKRFVSKIRRQANQLAQLGSLTLNSYPAVVTSCANTTLCTRTSLGSGLEEYRSISAEFRNLALEVVRKRQKIQGGRLTSTDVRYTDRAEMLLNQSLQMANSIPAFSSSCS